MRFIESIHFSNGEYLNLSLHQARINRTFEAFMPSIESHNLSDILPSIKLEGTYKVRIVYDADNEDAEYDLEFVEYVPRKIQTLRLVESSSFDYSFKFEDRSIINDLLKTSDADDIIICIDGLVTDSSYANLVFWNGEEWLTPNSPLINGVKRQQLLQEGKIKEAPIRVSEIGAFEKVSLINAMLGIGIVEVPIDKVLK